MKHLVTVDTLRTHDKFSAESVGGRYGDGAGCEERAAYVAARRRAWLHAACSATVLIGVVRSTVIVWMEWKYFDDCVGIIVDNGVGG